MAPIKLDRKRRLKFGLYCYNQETCKLTFSLQCHHSNDDNELDDVDAADADSVGECPNLPVLPCVTLITPQHDSPKIPSHPTCPCRHVRPTEFQEPQTFFGGGIGCFSQKRSSPIQV